MHRALIHICRSQRVASHHKHRLDRAAIRHFADAHPIDELTDKELSRPLQSTGAITGETATTRSAPPSPQSERDERLAKAQVIFGSRLPDPVGRRAELDRNSTRIAGVLVPPKPEEPDNCCMSGCVNCVWDRYREEFEDWAEKNAEAQTRLARQRRDAAALSDGQLFKPSSVNVAMSMDDDGGGSETNWSTGAADPFADVPVGIREFMKTEKRLKAKHAKELAGG